MAQRVGEHRMPVAVSPIHGQVWFMLRKFVFEGRDQVACLLVDGAFAIEVVVVLGHREHALTWNVASAQHIFEEWDDILPGFRATEGDNKDRVVVHACGWMACEFFAKKKCDESLGRGCLSDVRFRNLGGARVPPHPPTPVKGLTGAGFAKSVCKILKAKELKVKILKTKALRHFLGLFRRPPPPRPSSAHFAWRVKVRCHTRLWIAAAIDNFR